MPSTFYPVTEPHLDDEDRSHLLAAFDSVPVEGAPGGTRASG